MKRIASANTNTRLGFTLIEVMVVLGVVSLLTALLLPAVQKARESARRIECLSRVRQLALAAHQFQDLHGHLPSGTELTEMSSGIPTYRSWITRLLPHLDSSALYDSIESAYRDSPDSPFRSERHGEFKKALAHVSCPSDPRASKPQFCEVFGITAGMTSYIGSTGTNNRLQDGVFFGGSQIRFRDIRDGLSNTLLIGERPPSADFRFGWWYAGVGLDGKGLLDHHLGSAELNTWESGCRLGPYSLGFGSDRTGHCGQFQYWSYHDQSVTFALSDGSVRGISEIDTAVFTALGSRSGGEVISEW